MALVLHIILPMKPIFRLATCVLVLSHVHAFGDGSRDSQRVRRTQPLTDLGILTPDVREQALKFSDQTFDTLMAVGKAMSERLRALGYSNVDEAMNKRQAMESIRRAGKESLQRSLNLSEDEANRRIEGLTRKDCILGRFNRESIQSIPMSNLVPTSPEAPTAII